MTVCNKIPIAMNLALHNENSVHNPKTVLVYTLHRYRFRAADIERIVEWLEEDLKHHYQRRGALSPRLQVLLALRYFACGTFQEVVADTVRVHKSTVCRLIHRVAAALLSSGTASNNITHAGGDQPPETGIF